MVENHRKRYPVPISIALFSNHLRYNSGSKKFGNHKIKKNLIIFKGFLGKNIRTEKSGVFVKIEWLSRKSHF